MKIYKVSQNLQYLQNIGVPNETALPILEYLLSLEGDERKQAVRSIRQNPNMTLEELKNAKTGKAAHLENQNVPQSVIDYAFEINKKYSVWISREIMKWLKTIDAIGKKTELAKQDPNPDAIEQMWADDLSKIDPYSQKATSELYRYYQFLQSGGDLAQIVYKMANRERWKYIFDWAEQTNPNIMNMNLLEADEASVQWHRELAQKEVDESLKYKSHDVVFTFPDGWEIIKLQAGDCTPEGEKMGHCSKGYSDEVGRGNTEIYSLRDPKNEPHVTLEMSIPQTDSGIKIKIEQIQGKGNEEPIDEYKALIKQWFESLKQQGYAFEEIEPDESIDVSNFMEYSDKYDDYGIPFSMYGIGGSSVNYLDNLKDAYRSNYFEAPAIEAIDNLIAFALKTGETTPEEIETFEVATYSFAEWARDEFDRDVNMYDDPYAPESPQEPIKSDFIETYQAPEGQAEFQNAGFEDTKEEVFNEEAYDQAWAQYEEQQQARDNYQTELENEYPPTMIANYIIKEWNKEKAEHEKKMGTKMAATSQKTIKTAEKKIPKPEELAAYVEAMRIYLKNGKIKEPVIAKLIERLPYPDKILRDFSEEECKIVFESIAFAWKKITKQNLIEETKIVHAPKGLEGNYWMVTGGVILEGPNHFTIIKQNLNLFSSLLNISPFVMHEKMASPPDELIKTVLMHGGMRVFINKDRKGYFQMADDTYSKWGNKKIRKLDLHSKTVKVIDRTSPYKGWDSGILIKL